MKNICILKHFSLDFYPKTYDYPSLRFRHFSFFFFFVFLQSTDDTLKFPICQILIHLMKNLLDMLVYCITIGSDGEAIEWRRLSNRGYIANFVQDFLNLIFEWLDEFGSSWFYHLSDRIYPHFHQNNGKCRSFLIWQQLTWANAH